MFTNRIAGKAKFAPKAGLKRTRPSQVKNESKAPITAPSGSNEPTPVSQPVSENDQANVTNSALDSTSNLQVQNDIVRALQNETISSDAYPFDLTPQTSNETSPQHSPIISEADSISPYAMNSQFISNSDLQYIPIASSIPSASGLPSVADILAQNYNNAPQESHVPDSSNDVLQYQISQATQLLSNNKTARFRRASKPADINEDGLNNEIKHISKPRAPRKQKDPNSAGSTPKRACHIYEPHTLNFMNSFNNGVIELNSLPLKVLCNQHVFYGEGFISSNSGNEHAVVHDLSNEPAPSQLQQSSQDEDIKSNGPQFKIGADGKFVVDMESVVERKRKQPHVNSDSARQVTVNDDNRYYNCMTHVKRNKSSRWSADETNKFYEGLAQWGTDFSMIATMFENRNRSEIKNKFNREEKKFPTRVTDALLSRPRSRLTTPAPSVDSDSSRSDMTPALLTPPGSEFVQH